MLSNDIFELGKTINCHKIEFNVCPHLWTDADFVLTRLKGEKFREIKLLNDSGTGFNEQIESLPLNGGLYFFIVKATTIPDIASYLLYIGRAKKTKTHNLKIRCKRYFTRYNNEKERPKIARMMRCYGKYLYLRYVDLGDNNEMIVALEEKLINNILPPFNDSIPAKNIRDAIKAFT